MKYKIDETVIINNTEWRIAEYRRGRGREMRYTLSYEETDGTYTTMSINERAMDGLVKTGALIGSVDEIQK